MARPLRIQFPGALYHITARGNRLAPIYRDERDRRSWLNILDATCLRHHFTVFAYCQMTNHFHLLLETRDANLSRGMRQLNGQYSQYFNWRHALAGHLLQGRFHSVLVQRDSHLLELARYLVLNPVRAGMVAAPDQWPWSSYAWMDSAHQAPEWFDRAALLEQFGFTPASAVNGYRAFVDAGIGLGNPLVSATSSMVLGDEEFSSALRGAANSAALSREVPRAQRRPCTPCIEEFCRRFAERDEAIARAYESGSFSMGELGRFFGLSCRTIGRAVAKFETSKSLFSR